MYRDQDNQNYKKKRQINAVEIRKEKRQNIFSRKRNFNPPENDDDMSLQQARDRKIIIVDEERRDAILQLILTDFPQQQLPLLAARIFSNDIQEKHIGVIGVRKIISNGNKPPIQKVIDLQILPTIIDLMKQTIYPQLQLQAAWILTNVVSGTPEQCQLVVEKDVIPIFVRFLIEPKPNLVDQAVWAIGNIAGDVAKNRDIVLKAGALDPLINIMQTTTKKSLILQTVWAISNLCRGSPLPKYQNVKQALPVLTKAIKNIQLDQQTMEDCLWAISNLTEGKKAKIQKLIETNVICKLIELAEGIPYGPLFPAMRVLGNIATGNELQTQQLMKHNILDLIWKLLCNEKATVRREAGWILSNICAGTQSQVERILVHGTILSKSAQLLQSDQVSVKKQLCYIFSNLTLFGDSEKILQIYKELHIIQIYISMIEQNDTKLVEIVLQSLYYILLVGEKMKRQGECNLLIKQIINMPDAVNKIQLLQSHPSKNIYDRITKILFKFFDVESNSMDHIIQ